MIHFSALRTARLDVALRELTLQEAVDLAATPLERHETATAALLASVVDQAHGLHAEPGRWTVQERMLVVAHYLAATSEGGGNFDIGAGQLLDYLDAVVDAAPEWEDAGEACGDAWRIKQVTGDEAQAMEAICTRRLDWIAADIAARMHATSEENPPPDATSQPAAYAEWLAERKAVILAMPESDFGELFIAYRLGLDRLHHLFALDFDAGGHIALPRKQEGGLAPARFPVASAITGLAHILGS